jgi:hypothetical protein
MLRMEPQAPPRGVQQRRDALVVANRSRFARAEWKKAVKRGGDLLEPMTRSEGASDRGSLDVFDTMRVRDYLMALPKVGPEKARKIITEARVSPSKTLASVSVSGRRSSWR